MSLLRFTLVALGRLLALGLLTLGRLFALGRLLTLGRLFALGRLLTLGGRSLGLGGRLLDLLARLVFAALQTGGTGGLGGGLDAPMELVMAAIERREADAALLGRFCQKLADDLGALDVAAVGHVLANICRRAAGRRQGHALEVVDQLGVNVLGAAVDAQARALRSAD